MKRNLSKIKPFQVTQRQLKEWKKDKELICVIQCKCGKVHKIRVKYQTDIYCECGHNIIYCCLINWCRNKVLYKSKYLIGDNLHFFDPFR